MGKTGWEQFLDKPSTKSIWFISNTRRVIVFKMSDKMFTNKESINMTDSNTQTTLFTNKFDKAFQEKIVQAMILDKEWASQFQEVFNVDFLQFAHLKLITGKYLEYYKNYREFPSLDLFSTTILREELKKLNNEGLTSQVRDLMVRISKNENLSDMKFVKERSLDFCKKAALQNALEQSVDLIKTEKYEKIVDTIKNALAAGNQNTAGISLNEDNDIDARYSETYRNTVATGIPELDQRKILNGGLGEGEIGIVVAPSGMGKSQVLVHLGAQALLKGKNVIYYTYELNERLVGIRFDSHLANIDSLDCFEKKDKIKEFYNENESRLGRLRIKYYPTGSASVITLQSHVDKLASTGFVPDLILVDYAGIMRSTERYELLRHELKKVIEELRQFGAELGVPIWTALQSNKEGMNSDIIDMSNMAESFGQAHVADFILGLSRKSTQKSTGVGTIFIAKNRAGVDGIQYKIHLDTARSKLRVLTEDEMQDYQRSVDDETNDAFTVLRKKFNSI